MTVREAIHIVCFPHEPVTTCLPDSPQGSSTLPPPTQQSRSPLDRPGLPVRMSKAKDYISLMREANYVYCFPQYCFPYGKQGSPISYYYHVRESLIEKWVGIMVKSGGGGGKKRAPPPPPSPRTPPENPSVFGKYEMASWFISSYLLIDLRILFGCNMVPALF